MPEELFADSDRFPHDTVDGETVLIDSRSGDLFLFAGVGPVLWQRFMLGATIDDAVAELTTRYGESAADPTRRFLGELAEAQMLTPGASSSPTVADLEWPTVFEAPIIERFNEISDIINMDPIHDVDPAKGWPHRPDATS